MRATVETVVSRHKPPRGKTGRIHYVPVELDDEGYYEEEDAEHAPAVCGQAPAADGWLVIPEGLDHPEYGISHVMCDRCFARYVGPMN